MDKTQENTWALNYMKNFSCIGAECEDTCCAGWTIAIDEETYKKYKKVKDKTFKARLDREIVQKRSHMTAEHRAKIKLKNGRCAFLSQAGWCDIYSTLGGGYLSNTCRLYPRTVNRINNRLEYALITSCPEAVRHIVLNKEPIAFERVEDLLEERTVSAQINVSSHKAEKWQDYFLELRSFVIAVLQNRNEGLEGRLIRLKDFFQKLDSYTTVKDIKKIPELMEQYKNRHYAIKEEAMNVAWMTTLALEARHFKLNHKIKSKRYEYCLEGMLKGLGLESNQDIGITTKKYEEGYKRYYKPFIEEKGYIMENYLVNYVFERCVPVDKQKPSQSFQFMQLYYDLIKLHFIGVANDSEGMNEEKIVELIQAFSKAFDHEEGSLEGFEKRMKEIKN